MPYLASTDWLIFLLFVLGSIGIGVAMRSTIKSSSDYFQAGRAMGTGICAVAFLIAGIGAPEVLGLGAAGAAFGFRTTLYFVFGSIPALLIVLRFILPLWYGSAAVTLPGYLGLRFDAKTRTLSAAMFILMSLACSGIALLIVARVLQALRIFDRIFFAYGWPREGIFLVFILLAAVPVFIYVVIAGLRGTIVSHAVQFALLVAGFLPVVWAAIRSSGASSVMSSVNASIASQASGGRRIGIALAALAFGFVLGLSRWMTDHRAWQFPLVARSAVSARKAAAVAAVAWLAVPFLFVLPGAVAISLPTPQSTTTVRNENGAIYHEITIVPREISEGRGLVPALIDPATNNPRLDGSGHVQLDYGMATPNLLTHYATTGLLGLAIAGLLASLMSSVASAVIAVSTVFTNDFYGPLAGNSANDARELRIGRSASATAVLISVLAAFAIPQFSGQAHSTEIAAWLAAAVTVFAILQAPQLGTFVLGAFTVRTGGTSAFAGLVAGLLTTIVHYGLTLPDGAAPGFHGGWIVVLHQYHGLVSQMFFTVIFSFVANVAVATLTGKFAAEPAKADIRSLVYPPEASKPARKSAGKRAR